MLAKQLYKEAHYLVDDCLNDLRSCDNNHTTAELAELAEKMVTFTLKNAPDCGPFQRYEEYYYLSRKLHSLFEGFQQNYPIASKSMSENLKLFDAYLFGTYGHN